MLYVKCMHWTPALRLLFVLSHSLQPSVFRPMSSSTSEGSTGAPVPPSGTPAIPHAPIPHGGRHTGSPPHGSAAHAEKHFTLGFLGGGMMASALIRGLIKAEVLPAFCISVSDPYKPSLDKLAADGVITYDDNLKVVEHAQVLLLAVKPDMVSTVLRQIRNHVKRSHLIISIAAGVTIATLQHNLPEGARIVRVMPNTPCLVGEAAAAFAMGEFTTPDDREVVRRIFAAVGTAVEVKEKDLNGVTGLSGSGPAYVFLFIEALADGGVRAGLPRATALQLAAQTVKGAAEMVLATKEHPGVLKDQVCSPGGTTIAGVEALEKGAFRASAMAAVVAAAQRSKELSEPH